MNNIEQGGKLANKNGKILENTLIPVFENNGYVVICESDKNFHKVFDNADKIIIKNAKYKSIYGHNAKTEFLLINKLKNRKIRIECKWQQSSGSVDEKFPYLYLNCVFSFLEDEIILLVAGNGYKEGSYKWLEHVIDSKWQNEKNKKISLMNLDQFIKFVNNL